MEDASRLPHLQRPTYQSIEPEQVPNKRMAPQREAKIQPESLPRPLNRQDESLGLFTTTTLQVPTVDSIYYVKEVNISNPRLLRFTMTTIPLEKSGLLSTGLPLAAVWQPYAELHTNDDLIQQINTPPFRCGRCFGYVNAFFQFLDAKNKYVCNLCGFSADIPENYSKDRNLKIELAAGTYEFIAPKEYSNRPVQELLFLFCVDVSSVALELGIHAQVITSIRAILDFVPYPHRVNIGVIAFDTCFHIFKVLSNGELKEIIVNDPDDPFIPESFASFCYNLSTQKEKLEILLEKISEYSFQHSSKQSISIGALVFALKEHMLKNRGGRVIIFTSQLGAIGKFPLASRPEMASNHNEKEKSYLPSDAYVGLGNDCCGQDICIDIFACTTQSINAPNLAVLCGKTGGDFYHFPDFSLENDGERLYYLITRIVTRPQCTQISMRTRCSTGLSVDYYIGKFKKNGALELEISSLDSDKSIGIVLKYDEKLVESNEYFVQSAMLYTNIEGQRLIRIFNGRLVASKNIVSVLRYSDIDSLSNIMLRIAANNLFELPLTNIIKNWYTDIIKLLIVHRNSIGDFDMNKILVPETLKLLSLYCISSLKLPALSINQISLDSRISSVYSILSMTCLKSRLILYPKIYSIYDISYQTHNPGTISASSQLILPKLVPNRRESLKSEGVYLISNGETVVFYIGKNVNSEFLMNVWGLESPQELFCNSEYWNLRDLENEESQKVLAIVEEVRRRNPSEYACLKYYFEDLTDNNKDVCGVFVEDKNQTELEYGELLLRFHRAVISNLHKNESSLFNF